MTATWWPLTAGRALLAALAAEADIELARTAMVRLVVVGFAAPPLPGHGRRRINLCKSQIPVELASFCFIAQIGFVLQIAA
jgi:hypothetical protein